MTIKLLMTVWSIRLALVLFAVVLIVRFHAAGRCLPQSGRGWQAVRVIWLAGWLFAMLHLFAVFGYVMQWSHQLAIEDTARRTRQLIGVSFGGGVYFNYAFLMAWAGDAIWWCGWPEHYRRRAWLWDVLVIGYLWFIAFNATVVFATGAVRWLGLLATLAMAAVGFAALVARKRYR